MQILKSFFAFHKKFFFSYACKLVQPIRRAYADHVTKDLLLRYFLQTNLRKTSYLSMLRENTASSFKLTKQKFALLAHSLFNRNAMQVLSNIWCQIWCL